jgi:hypothetical protein
MADIEGIETVGNVAPATSSEPSLHHIARLSET